MKETLPQVQTENQKYADISAYSRKDLKKKKKNDITNGLSRGAKNSEGH